MRQLEKKDKAFFYSGACSPIMLYVRTSVFAQRRPENRSLVKLKARNPQRTVSHNYEVVCHNYELISHNHVMESIKY